MAAVVDKLSVKSHQRKHARSDRIHRVLRGHTGEPRMGDCREVKEVKYFILVPGILLYKAFNTINCKGVIIENNILKWVFVRLIGTDTKLG